jgi:hypothetical protein
MSDKPAKTFVDAVFFKARTFQDGGKIISADIKCKEFFEFAKQHKGEDGYLRIDIQEKNPANIKEGGNTHYAVLNTWKPKSKTDGSAADKPAAPTKKKTAAPETTTVEADDEQPPF